MVIAHQIHIFPRFAQDGVVDNDCLVVEGNLAARE